MKYAAVKNFIGAKFVEFAGDHAPVVSPLDGSLLSEVPQAGTAEVAAAVTAAKAAFPGWSGQTLKQRAAVMYRYRELLVRHTGDLAEVIHEENGKTVNEARAE